MTTNLYQSSNYVFDNLLASNFPVLTRNVTIGASQTLKRGSVLGKNTSNEYVLSLSASSDGSEDPIAIAAEPITTGVGETKNGVVYIVAHVKGNQLEVGTGHTIENITEPLRTLGIYIES